MLTAEPNPAKRDKAPSRSLVCRSSMNEAGIENLQLPIRLIRQGLGWQREVFRELARLPSVGGVGSPLCFAGPRSSPPGKRQQSAACLAGPSRARAQGRFHVPRASAGLRSASSRRPPGLRPPFSLVGHAVAAVKATATPISINPVACDQPGMCVCQ